MAAYLRRITPRARTIILVVLGIIATCLVCSCLAIAGLSLFNNRGNTANNASRSQTTDLNPTSVTNVAWYDADTPYKDNGEWTGPHTCTGPAVCEWYVGQGTGFGLEGFVFLYENETIKFPSGYIGHSWQIPAGNPAINLLWTSYRHLLFYSNTLTPQELSDLKQYFWDWPNNPPVKSQHAYMAEWLKQNGYGDCTFKDQKGCTYLSPMVNRPPDGVTIKTP